MKHLLQTMKYSQGTKITDFFIKFLSFALQVRSLRLRLLKTDRIDKAHFHITSVQDDQSEINLSSGNVSVDLLHKQEDFKDDGTIFLIKLLKVFFC